MKKSTKALAFISGMLLTGIPAHAAGLSGRVTVRGKPLEGAVVTANLIGEKGPAAVSVTKTDPRGEYVLRGLRNGNYILLVDLSARRIYQGRIVLTDSAQVKNIGLK